MVDTKVSKNALIVVSSQYYMRGLNILLNGLEYYGTHDVDVYVLYGQKPVNQYLEYAKDKFSFRVIPIANSSYQDPILSPDANFAYNKYHLMLDVIHKYKAVCVSDADCMILDNLTNYFKIIEHTDLILSPTNIRSSRRWEDIPYVKTDADREQIFKSQPIWVFLWFFNPVHHRDVIEALWESRLHIKNGHQSTVHPRDFCKTLFELGKHDKVIQLTGSIWIGDDYLHKFKINKRSIYGRDYLCSPTGDRISCMHQRWWIPGHRKRALEAAGQVNPVIRDRTVHNIKIIQQMEEFLASRIIPKDKIEELGLI